MGMSRSHADTTCRTLIGSAADATVGRDHAIRPNDQPKSRQVSAGGTSLAGGFGSMWRIVQGCIVVGALALDVYARRLADRAAARDSRLET
jgi:hypothetical protein